MDAQKKTADALAELKKTMADKAKADKALKASQTLSGQLHKTIKDKDSEIGSRQADLDATKRLLDQNAKERAEAAKVNNWAAYTQNLVDADKAYFENNSKLMKKKLAACPRQYRAWEWHYLKELADGKKAAKGVVPLTEHLVDISPDAKWLLTETKNIGLAVYEPPKAIPTSTYLFDHNKNRIDVDGLSPNGNFMLFYDAQIVHDFATGTPHPIKWQPHHSDGFAHLNRGYAFAFSPDGTYILFRDNIGRNRLVSMQSGKPVAHYAFGIPMDDRFSGFTTFTPKGELAGVDLSESPIKLSICGCDVDLKPKPTRTINLPTPGNLSIDADYDILFSNDKPRLALISSPNLRIHRRGRVYDPPQATSARTLLFDLQPPRLVSDLDHEGIVSLSPDGRRFAIMSWSHKIELWDATQDGKRPCPRSARSLGAARRLPT